jgi:hypothetical protein
MVGFGPETILKAVLSGEMIWVQNRILHRTRQVERQQWIIELRRQRMASIDRALALLTRLEAALASEVRRRDCPIADLSEFDDTEQRKTSAVARRGLGSFTLVRRRRHLGIENRRNPKHATNGTGRGRRSHGAASLLVGPGSPPFQRIADTEGKFLKRDGLLNELNV